MVLRMPIRENLRGQYPLELVCADVPQNVLPKTNQWAPDARPNSVGEEDRTRPETPPKMTPQIPEPKAFV